MSFILANKSSNLYEYIAQLNRLASLTDKYILNTENVEGPFINVPENFLLKNECLPSKFKGKVSISPLSPFNNELKDDLKLHTLEILNKDANNELINAYVKSLHDSFVALWDDSPLTLNINVNLFEHLIKLIIQEKSLDLKTFTLTIFLINARENFQSKFKKITENFNVKILTLPFELSTLIMLQCNNHILTGSLASTFVSKILDLKDNFKLVFTSIPMIDDSTPNKGFTCVNVRRESTKYFDKIYYINLTSREDRKMHMEKQLAELNIAAARVSAVNGKELKWDLNYGIISKFWNTSAAAYCLSYQNAIIDAIKNNYNKVLIMDDDAVLTSNFYEVLNESFKSLPENWHLLYLAANHNKKCIPTEKDRISDNLYKLSGSLGSHAIIINKAAFNTILNFCSTPYGPLDIFLSIYQQIFPCYITYPGLASQLPGKSDILDISIDYSKDWNIDYIDHLGKKL